MILKEFRLYLNDDAELPALFEQKGINLGNPKYKKRNESFTFSTEARCVAGYMERMRKKRIDTECWGLNIYCGKNEAESIMFPGFTCHVYISFPYEDYLNASAIEKKEYLLDALIRGIEKIGIPEGWDLEEIYQIRDMLIENGYKNEWLWKKRIRRDDAAYYVSVEAVHELHEFEMYVNLYNRKKELIERRKVVTELPDEWFFYHYFGKVKWESDTEVVIYCKDNIGPVSSVKVDFSNVIE